MAFTAKDGSKHTNMDTMKRADFRTASKAPAAPAPADDGSQGGAPPIQSDPEAMQCVQILQQKGYTAQDVEAAMGGGEQPGTGGEPEGY
jgi:hypothetical protein